MMEFEALTPAADPVRQQVELEMAMTAAGQKLFLDRNADALEKNRASETPAGVALVNSLTVKLSETIDEFVEHAKTKPGVRARAIKYLDQMDSRTAAFLALKSALNCLLTSPTLTAVCLNIGGAIEDELNCRTLRAADEKLYNRLCQAAKERDSYHAKRNLFLNVAKNRGHQLSKWKTEERELVGMKMVDLIQSAVGLIEISEERRGKKTTKYVSPTAETLKWIREKTEAVSLIMPHYEPMIVEPLPWSDARGGGYLTSYVKPLTLVKTNLRGYLDDLGNHELDAVTSAINAAQNTPWKVNNNVLDALEHAFNSGVSFGKLPAREPGPKPAKPVDVDTNVAARKKYKHDAKWWHIREKERKGKAMQLAMTIITAKKYSNFPAIYLPYQFDFRGRLYAVSRLNPQGTDFTKALLQFSEGKQLGEEGAYWLAVHLANVGDFDKVSKKPFDVRVQWVQDNQDDILACALNPHEFTWWENADKPWQFLAACFEWLGYVKEGDNFVSHLPIALDGSCSGIQHFSMAFRDEVGGKAVNLIPTDTPQDIYSVVQVAVEQAVEEDIISERMMQYGKGEDGSPNMMSVSKLAQQWKSFGITRTLCKRPTMTYGYGARGFGFTDQIIEDILKPAMKKRDADNGPWPFDDNGYSAAIYMANVITKAVENTVVKAAEAMKWLQSVASLAASDAMPVSWTAPDGLPVLQNYPETRMRRVKTTIGGATFKLAIREPIGGVDKRRQRQGIAPNFVHSLDACHLRMAVVKASNEGMTSFALVHDSFGVHAADTSRFFSILRETLVSLYTDTNVIETFSEEIIAQLPEQLVEKFPDAPGCGSLDLEGVLKSEFAFA